MKSVIDGIEARTGLDIGANAGFFALSLAAAGLPTIAVENDPTFVRILMYASKTADVADLGVLDLTLSPTTIDLLPRADVVVCLSVWHHFVRHYGFEEATSMLTRIWEGTRGVLFFDTGEEEMSPAFNLPAMRPTPREWLTAYLERACEGGTVRHLGLHEGFYASDRNLFAVIRNLTG